MVIFILWTGLFAIEFYVLRSNSKDAAGFEGVPTAVGYLLLAFENGIGNIQPPTVDVWVTKNGQSFSATLIVYLIYIVWFLNQFILLIVLLNFVIALISEVYERVMD